MAAMAVSVETSLLVPAFARAAFVAATAVSVETSLLVLAFARAACVAATVVSAETFSAVPADRLHLSRSTPSTACRDIPCWDCSCRTYSTRGTNLHHILLKLPESPSSSHPVVCA